MRLTKEKAVQPWDVAVRLARKPCVVRSPVPHLRQRHPRLGSALVVLVVAAATRLQSRCAPWGRGRATGAAHRAPRCPAFKDLLNRFEFSPRETLLLRY